ncbi:MAG TPA: hypothetical protein VFE41_23725 [Acetobacteraceae bacterium]|jgi:hypothetical protein|nr:hypothetical protein [Acetobacteraceae bacterium]
MNSVPISAIIITILFGSALITMFVVRFLPGHHLSPETKSVISVSMAVIGTLSALVVGLLISTANSSFIAKAQEIADISADVISLDRLMQRFGTEAQDGRVLLRHYTAAELQDLFPENSDQAPNMENIATVSILEELQNKIVALMPANDTQRWLQAQSLQLTTAIMAARWQLAQGTVSTPRPLLLLVLFWFVIIFASFGLFAPLNPTSIVAILLCSVGVGSAIRIITELQEPFGGLMRVSNTSLTHALEVISR